MLAFKLFYLDFKICFQVNNIPRVCGVYFFQIMSWLFAIILIPIFGMFLQERCQKCMGILNHFPCTLNCGSVSYVYGKKVENKEENQRCHTTMPLWCLALFQFVDTSTSIGCLFLFSFPIKKLHQHILEDQTSGITKLDDKLERILTKYAILAYVPFQK